MKIDARKLSTDELFTLRKRIVAMRRNGVPVMRIAEECGLSWDAVNAAIKLSQREGKSLKPKPRGRKQGTGRILSPDQEERICQTLYMKKPYQVGLTDPDRRTAVNVRLWSLERVRQYIHNECDIDLSTACLSLYLDRWGLRVEQKSSPPIERCTREIQQWLKENFEGRDINRAYWVVRKTINATIQNDPYRAPRKQRLSIVTAINAKKSEEDYWCVYRGNFTKERQIGFMKFLMLQSDRKVLIVRTSVDHFTHLKIESFRRKNSKRIEIIPPLLPAERDILNDRQQALQDASMLRQS